MSITPKPVSEWTPQEALLMYPSMDLDRWIFLRVLEGPGDFGGFMPRVSQAFAECQPLVVQTMMTTGAINIELSQDFFYDAIAAGHLHKKGPCPIWRMKSGSYTGYGRTFAEAICKLSISRIFDLKAPVAEWQPLPDPGNPS